MGREVRHVPTDWQHPKDHIGHFIPLYGGSYKKALDEWIVARQKWQEGLREDWHLDKPSDWVPIEARHANMTFEEYQGDAPQFSDYMPDCPESKRTHLQMYETCTEGTPISPVMDTPENLARWLADNNASAFGDQGASYEAWLATIKRGWAISAIGAPGMGLKSGVEALADMEKGRPSAPAGPLEATGQPRRA